MQHYRLPMKLGLQYELMN